MTQITPSTALKLLEALRTAKANLSSYAQDLYADGADDYAEEVEQIVDHCCAAIALAEQELETDR